MSRTFRFLQISDLHLDSRLSGGRFALPPHKREHLNQDMVRALGRAVNMARDNDVDAILLPGDAWDDESVSLATAAQFFDVLAKAAPIPVIIAPGNHDPYHVFSFYNAAYYQSRTGRPHPDNVFIFNTSDIRPMHVPTLPGVTFYGCCFTENRPRSERILRGVKPDDTDGLHILLLHGSQDDIVAPDPDAMATAPFSREELLACGFDYTALGHYHRYSELRDDSGRIRAAYGGIPVARGLDETEDHRVILGEVEPGGIRPDNGWLAEYMDVRHVKRITVDIDSSVLSAQELERRIEAELHNSGTTVDDMVYVMLRGYTHPEIESFSVDPQWRETRCFHLVIDQSGLMPDYDDVDISTDAEKHVEGRFNQKMLELIEQAGDDEKRVRQLRLARSLGLDALRGREVKPRNVY